MKIVIASDHGGYSYKEEIKKWLSDLHYIVLDAGTNSEASCDYPDFAIKAGEMVAHGEADFGIVICRTGEGISIAANKVKGVRCGVGYHPTVARLMRVHNDANMISFGADFFSLEQIKEMISIFLSTNFLGEKHLRRVNKITQYEK